MRTEHIKSNNGYPVACPKGNFVMVSQDITYCRPLNPFAAVSVQTLL